MREKKTRQKDEEMQRKKENDKRIRRIIHTHTHTDTYTQHFLHQEKNGKRRRTTKWRIKEITTVIQLRAVLYIYFPVHTTLYTYTFSFFFFIILFLISCSIIVRALFSLTVLQLRELYTERERL